MTNELPSIYRIAIEALLAGSKEIMKIYQTNFEPHFKEDGSPVTVADLNSSDAIHKHLSMTNIPITGEEIKKMPYQKRSVWRKVWCVDPLDGTKEFVKKNDEFVINIALIDDGTPIFGVIGSPVYRKIIIGGKDFGAYQMDYDDSFSFEKWQRIPKLDLPKPPLHLISSRSHYSGNFLKLVENLEEKYGKIESITMGSALKFFDLVNQKADIYPRFAPTMEWDIAAGQAIFEAIGGRVIDIETRDSLSYNKKDLKNPYFIAFNPKVEIENF